MRPPIPHTLTITETTEAGITSRHYTATCPGVTDHCRALRLCEVPGCDLDDEDHDEVEAHDQLHIWVDDADGWYVPTADCCLATHDALADAAEPLSLPIGHHAVIPYFGDACELELAHSVGQTTTTHPPA